MILAWKRNSRATSRRDGGPLLKTFSQKYPYFIFILNNFLFSLHPKYTRTFHPFSFSPHFYSFFYLFFDPQKVTSPSRAPKGEGQQGAPNKDRSRHVPTRHHHGQAPGPHHGGDQQGPTPVENRAGKRGVRFPLRGKGECQGKRRRTGYFVSLPYFSPTFLPFPFFPMRQSENEVHFHSVPFPLFPSFPLSLIISAPPYSTNYLWRTCRYKIKFDIELCNVAGIQGLYGLHFKKVNGSVWLFRSLSIYLIDRMKL